MNPRILRVGTFAPKNSPRGKVLSAWGKALEQQTNGRLNVDILYNGTAGLESTMVRNIRAGQLEGALLTDWGLGRVNPATGVLALPGVATQWVEVDQVRRAVDPELDAGFQRVGFHRVLWDDLGRVRLFTRGFAAHFPADLRGRSVTTDCDPMLFSSLGTTFVLKPVYQAPLRQNVDASCNTATFFSAFQQLGFDHVHDESIASVSGAMVFDSQTIALMPSDLRRVFDQMGARVGQALLARMRSADDQAYQELAQTMTVVTRSRAERAAWAHVYRARITWLANVAVGKSLVNKALQARGRAPIP